jgi:predicted branched-subunit amino acid permease
VGFVTPGAPGGVGVREAVFLLLVGPAVTSADPGVTAAVAASIAATVVVGRLQSVVADVIVFVVARALAPTSDQGREATSK